MPRLSLSWLVAGALCGVAARARASQSVVVHAADATPEPLLGRLCAELASAGYAVSLQLSAPPTTCERGNGAHVAVAPDPVQGTLVATICFEGTQVVVTSAEGSSARFAISAAEALNGLYATARLDEPERPRVTPPPKKTSPRAQSHHAMSVGQTLVVDPAGFPPLWGATVDLELGLGAHAALVLGGFFPVARAGTSTEHAELSTGVTFMRVGPALRYDVGRFALAPSLTIGPAYTWVTAQADAPYIGETDATFSVVGSAGLALAYPAHSAVFAAATTRASLLLPSPRIQVPGAARRDLGPLLLEASLSFGLRL